MTLTISFNRNNYVQWQGARSVYYLEAKDHHDAGCLSAANMTDMMPVWIPLASESLSTRVS